MTSPEKIAFVFAVFAVFGGLFFVADRYAGPWRPVTIAGAAGNLADYGHYTGRWQRHSYRGGRSGSHRACNHSPQQIARFAAMGADWLALAPDQKPAYEALVVRMTAALQAAADLCQSFEKREIAAGSAYAPQISKAAAELERMAGLVADLAEPTAAFEAVLTDSQKQQLDALMHRKSR